MNKLYQLLFLTVIVLSSCKNEEDIPKIDSDFPIQGAVINMDATSPEIISVKTNTQENVTFYGIKNENGLATEVTTIEVESTDNRISVIDLDEQGKPIRIASEAGYIEYEWLSSNKIVIKCHSVEDNRYIQTVWDPSVNIGELKSSRSSLTANRYGDATLDVTYMPEFVPEMVESIMKMSSKSRAQYDPNEYPSNQEVWLWINQCGANYDAKPYLMLKDDDGNIISKIFQYERITKGSYTFNLPISSYPAKATNAEMCKNIDEKLRALQAGCDFIFSNTQEIVAFLNSVAVATDGIAFPIAFFADLIWATAAVGNVSLYMLENDYGGIEGIMRNGNSEWFYKEYIISDLHIIPVAMTSTKTVSGEPHLVQPGDENIFITLDMEGDPVIDSFVLEPSHPGRGQSYTATADFHCIPSGSIITLSIIGTDGYSDSISKSISDNGSAKLYVPGAETGVFDVCDAQIKLPTGETISMSASLVFGN